MIAESLFHGFTFLVTTYFVLWNLVQFLMSVPAAIILRQYLRRRGRRNLALLARLVKPPLVSVVVPAHNEGLTIVESVRALLALDYHPREIVVVNDGSKDNTLEILRRTFQLLPAPLAFDPPLKTARMRGVYRSVLEPALVVIDKEAGGCKSDAANAGINVASGWIVAVIDADTVLEPDALTRGVIKFIENRHTIAVGGYVGISNGGRIEQGRLVSTAMPRSWLARFQIVEYMRSFLMFRLACSWMNGVVLISGAFGLFRRDALIAVGGFDIHAIGEDMDLTLRLQRHFRERGEPIRIGFVPLPVCWTQAPEDFQSLAAQRRRWRRGLLQVLWRHRRTIGNPRYGVVGVGVMPYISFFDGLGPLLELAGYAITLLAIWIGVLQWAHFQALLAATLLFGVAATLISVFLSDIYTRRYMTLSDLAILIITAMIECVGYRQLNAWWGLVGTVQAMKGTGGWGPMTRKSF